MTFWTSLECTGNCLSCATSGSGKCDVCTAGNGPAPKQSCGGMFVLQGIIIRIKLIQTNVIM